MSTSSTSHDDDQERELDAEGIPSVGDATDAGMVPPGDRAQGAESFGTTAAEQQRGESLADRVGREEPDVLELVAIEAEAELAEVDDTEVVGAGRLVATDTDETELFDDEAGSFGIVADGDPGALSAEEAAMRIEVEPAGLNYDDNPGYLS